MNNEEFERLKDIKIENFIWVIYIGIILLSWYSNSLEKNYILYKDEESREKYQELLILIFSILVIVYAYFTYSSYEDLVNLSNEDSKKKKNLTYASFVGSLLILISGIIFLIIAIMDDNIDVELAFKVK